MGTAVVRDRIGGRRAAARRGASWPRWGGAAALACCSAATMSFAAVPGAAAQEDSAPSISVAYTPAGTDEPCGAPVMVARYETIHTAERFTLRITTSAPLCSPVTAVAAIYRMPGNGVAWPQQLGERQEFMLEGAGRTDVVFDKGCGPVQFDVVVGATPDTIAPWGQWHGPLLFPNDTATTLQYWGGNCGGPSTTAPPTSTIPPETSSTVPPSPTTTAPEVVPTTISQSSVTTTPVEVLGATTTSVPGPATGESSAGAGPAQVAGTSTPRTVAGLALTGTAAKVLVVGGAALTLCGVALMVASRRSQRSWR